MPPSPPDRSDSTRTWYETLDSVGLGVFVTGVSVISTYLGVCFGALLLYAFIFPPVTGVQLQRSAGNLFGSTDRTQTYTPVPLKAIDWNLARAAVSGEDSRFFVHWGIDWSAIRTAVSEYRSGEDLRGGSSITQQLVKNLFMTTHRSYLRKAFEVPLTYAAELVLTKRRILELYLNVIEWDHGVYGAEAAAQHYYGTSARTLTRAQAAALAACIPDPHGRRPQTVAWYRDIILQRMAVLGPLPVDGVDREPVRVVDPPREPTTTASPTEDTTQAASLADSATTDSVRPSLPDSIEEPKAAPPESMVVAPAAPETLTTDSIDTP